MSKFRVIEGSGQSNNVKEITRIRDLDREVGPIEHTLNNRGLVTYAYHYAISGAARRAEDLLEKVHPAYFNGEIYKDLYHCLFCWSAYLATNRVNPKLQKEAEYFVVVKRSLEYFKHLKFRAKPGFVNFYKDHMSKVKYTKTH